MLLTDLWVQTWPFAAAEMRSDPHIHLLLSRRKCYIRIYIELLLLLIRLSPRAGPIAGPRGYEPRSDRIDLPRLPLAVRRLPGVRPMSCVLFPVSCPPSCPSFYSFPPPICPSAGANTPVAIEGRTCLEKLRINAERSFKKSFLKKKKSF